MWSVVADFNALTNPHHREYMYDLAVLYNIQSTNRQHSHSYSQHKHGFPVRTRARHSTAHGIECDAMLEQN